MVPSPRLPDCWAASIVSKLWNFEGNTLGLSSMLKEAISDPRVKQADLKNLALELLRAATMTSMPEKKLFECLKILVNAECISWTTLILTLTTFNQYRKVNNAIFILKMLDVDLPRLSCAYVNLKECQEFTDAVVELFSWFIDCLNDRTYTTDDEDKAVIDVLLLTISKYITNPFIFRILQLATVKHGDTIRSSVIEPLAKIKSDVPLSLFGRIETLEMELNKVFQPMEFNHTDLIARICKKQRRSGIRSLTAVFMSFRVLTPVQEMTDTYLMFGRLYGFEPEQLISDILHAALLILMDEHEMRDKDCVRSLSVQFFFIKLPKAFQLFIQREYITKKIVASAIHKLITNFKQELDSVDASLKESSMGILLKEMCSAGIVDENDANLLTTERQEQIKAHIDLHQSLIANREDQKPVALVLNSRNVKGTMERTWHLTDKFVLMLPRLLSIGGVLLDSICSTFCVDGNLSEFTYRLASLSRQSEDVSFQFDRLVTFDVSFLLLARISLNIPSLSLEELVSGKNEKESKNFNGLFYTWSSVYMKRIRPIKPVVTDSLGKGEPAESEQSKYPIVPDNVKLQYRESVLRMKDRHIFWDPKTQSFSQILELIPIIGSVWLEEFKERKSDEERLHCEFKRIVYCFRGFTCLLVCLTQWLECQPECDSRRQMARCLKEAIDEHLPEEKEEKDRYVWLFVRNVCRRQLEDIFNAPTSLHPVSITLKSIALRTFPECQRLQVPDTNVLKDGWLFAQRQNWFNHRPLTLIDHCNRAKQHRRWIRLFIQNLMKLRAQDVMGKAVEFLSAILLLDPIRSIVITLEVLFDLLLELGQEGLDETSGEVLDDMAVKVQYESPFIIPLVKLTVQVLFMGIWVVDLKKSQAEGEPKEKKKKTEMDGEASESEQVDELFNTIKVCIQHMNQATKQGVFSPSVSVVYHVMKTIASSPPSKSKHMLIQCIPHDLLFRLARLDPCGVPLEMFCQFCDLNQQGQEEEKLRFLCMLRKCRAL